jgi:hypothetical protein
MPEPISTPRTVTVCIAFSFLIWRHILLIITTKHEKVEEKPLAPPKKLDWNRIPPYTRGKKTEKDETV